MNIVQENKKQYVYIKTTNSGYDYIFLSNQPKNTDDYQNAIIYDCFTGKFWHYINYQEGSKLINNEFEVLCVYKENFIYKENKYWQFMNMIQKYKKDVFNADAYKN